MPPRMILEWRGARFEVKDCASCPARSHNFCRIRKVRLRSPRGRFPVSPVNRCPVRPEGSIRRIITEKLSLTSEETRALPGTAWPFPVACSWCGRAVDPKKAVLVVNDSEPNRIYDRFECLEQYLRTNNK